MCVTRHYYLSHYKICTLINFFNEQVLYGIAPTTVANANVLSSLQLSQPWNS